MNEAPELNDAQIATRILELLQESVTGLSDADLTLALNISQDRKLVILNKLMVSKYINPIQKQNTIYYLYQDPLLATILESLPRDAKTIYDIISAMGTDGISKNDLNKRSGYNSTNVTNALKVLEKNGLIRSVKSIKQKNKNIYILFDLDPNEEVTGGKWYKNNQFDKKFVDVFCEKTLKYIKSENSPIGVSFNSISNYLTSTELNKGDTRDDHVKDILNVLIYNGEIEEIPSSIKDNPSYKISDWTKIDSLSVFTSIPCGTCPMFVECKEGGVISPENCVYFLDW